MTRFPESIRIVDSHTEGEPTRVVVGGWPAPEGDSMRARRRWMEAHQEPLRRATVREPRGHEAIVGALLTPPVEPGSVAGVVFFNNVGYLGMCGHGLIGVVCTLRHLGRLAPGEVRVDTPVGTVSAFLDDEGAVTVANVPARVHELDVTIDVPGLGPVTGDVAWGGNWFFLVEEHGEALEMANLPRLLALTRAIREGLDRAEILPPGEGPIDHVELVGPSPTPGCDGRNFVLCPGGEYDRSPCGTGTSAGLAVRRARGGLALDQVWRQESVTGGRFEAWLAETPEGLRPHVRGRAWVTGEGRLLFDPSDPFRAGFASG